MLMRASAGGLTSTVAKLVSLGASLGLTDKENKTSLMVACASKHAATAEMLMPATAAAGVLDAQVHPRLRTVWLWAWVRTD